MPPPLDTKGAGMAFPHTTHISPNQQIFTEIQVVILLLLSINLQ